MARDACMPAIVAASTQPTLKPLSTQSPAMTMLLKPVSPAFIRYFVLPFTVNT